MLNAHVSPDHSIEYSYDQDIDALVSATRFSLVPAGTEPTKSLHTRDRAELHSITSVSSATAIYAASNPTVIANRCRTLSMCHTWAVEYVIQVMSKNVVDARFDSPSIDTGPQKR